MEGLSYLTVNWLRSGGVVLLGECSSGLWPGGEYWLTGGDILYITQVYLYHNFSCGQNDDLAVVPVNCAG